MNLPMIKWIGEYQGVVVPVLDEYESRRDKCVYVFFVMEFTVRMCRRDEIVYVSRTYYKEEMYA